MMTISRQHSNHEVITGTWYDHDVTYWVLGWHSWRKKRGRAEERHLLMSAIVSTQPGERRDSVGSMAEGEVEKI